MVAKNQVDSSVKKSSSGFKEVTKTDESKDDKTMQQTAQQNAKEGTSVNANQDEKNLVDGNKTQKNENSASLTIQNANSEEQEDEDYVLPTMPWGYRFFQYETFHCHLCYITRTYTLQFLVASITLGVSVYNANY